MTTISKLSPVAGVYEFPTIVPTGFTRVTVYARNPARVYFADVPSIDTSSIPAEFKAVVEGAIDDLLAGALKRVLTTNPEATSCADSLFTLDAISTNASRERMTSDRLLALWHQSHKYVYTVAPKFTELQGTMLLKYKARVEKIEKLMGLLTGRAPELRMSGADLDAIILNLAPEDLDSEFGQYVAERCETIRGMLIEDLSSAL